MKEAFAAALGGFQNLDASDVRERPVDRLTALAASQIAHSRDAQRAAALCSLGVDLIRFKASNIAAAKQDAEDKLAAALRWPNRKLKATFRQRDIVARWAVMEYAIDLCPMCAGAREVPDHDLPELLGKQPMRKCPPQPIGCGGSGRRHYTDAERIQAMGRAYAQEMQEAHRLIAWAVSLANETATKLLENWNR